MVNKFTKTSSRQLLSKEFTKKKQNMVTLYNISNPCFGFIMVYSTYLDSCRWMDGFCLSGAPCWPRPLLQSLFAPPSTTLPGFFRWMSQRLPNGLSNKSKVGGRGRRMNSVMRIRQLEETRSVCRACIAE